MNGVRSTVATKPIPSAGSDHWALSVKEAVCMQCKQSTHGYDRDGPPGAYLVWTKCNFYESLNNYLCQGSECGPCLYTRYKYYEKGTTWQMLKAKREEDPQEDEKFLRYRAMTLQPLWAVDRARPLVARPSVTTPLARPSFRAPPGFKYLSNEVRLHRLIYLSASAPSRML